MKFVYILQSLADAERYYVGVTDDLRARLQRHNSGQVNHTSRYLPWKVKTYVGFSDELQAIFVERYLKPASGRAFARKRL
jgi:putative endonuclease